MKNEILFLGILIVIVTAGCQQSYAPVTVTSLPSQTVTPMQPTPFVSKTPTLTATRTGVVSTTPTGPPAISPGTQITQQCLVTTPAPPTEVTSSGSEILDSVTPFPTLSMDWEVTSSGIVVLESRVIEDGRYKPDVYLLDMATGNIAISEPGGGFVISPDKKLIAYISAIIDDQDRIVSQDLIIADASGQRQKTISWQDEWEYILSWSDIEHLVFYSFVIDGRKVNVLLEPAPILVLNVVNGEQQVLLPGFSGFVANAGVLPYWNGQSGVAYDPTLTRAIYLRFFDDNEETYTYAIWDLENDRLVASLEEIFVAFAVSPDISISPMPHWSPDGSHFVLIGRVYDEKTDEYVEKELYRVSRDGETEKLTALNPFLAVEDFNLSWSPDERYIVVFLKKYYGFTSIVRLAVLDTETLVITDTCMDVYNDVPPIWSPDGSQFLVWDHRYEKVILVDIEEGLATIIAEGMEPVGWLVNE